MAAIWRAYLALILSLWLSVPAWAQAVNAPTTNGSVTITTGGTFQQALAAVSIPPAIRRSLTIENNNTNGDNCWVFLGATASATEGTAVLLGQGGAYTRYYPYVPSDAIQVTCATTSDTVYVDTQ